MEIPSNIVADTEEEFKKIFVCLIKFTKSGLLPWKKLEKYDLVSNCVVMLDWYEVSFGLITLRVKLGMPENSYDKCHYSGKNPSIVEVINNENGTVKTYPLAVYCSNDQNRKMEDPMEQVIVRLINCIYQYVKGHLSIFHEVSDLRKTLETMILPTERIE